MWLEVVFFSIYIIFIFTGSFTLNLLLLTYEQFFLSHPFGAQKGAKGTAQRKISYSLLGSQIFVNENVLRSSFACRRLSFASRGSVKFGHTCGASENLPLFSAPYCSLRLWFLQRCIFFEVTVGNKYYANSNIKILPAPLKIVQHLFIEWGIAWLVRKRIPRGITFQRCFAWLLLKAYGDSCFATIHDDRAARQWLYRHDKVAQQTTILSSGARKSFAREKFSHLHSRKLFSRIRRGRQRQTPIFWR